VADALKITVLNTKTSSAAVSFAPLTPTGSSAPWTLAGGSAPGPHYRLALPRSPWVCVWPQLLFTIRVPYTQCLARVNQLPFTQLLSVR